MTRKEFLISCGTMATGAALSGLFLQGCAGIHYASWTRDDNKLTIPKSEFTEQKGQKTIERDLVLIKTAASDIPIAVHKSGPDNYTAVLLRCTHRGCELNPGGGQFNCPCHGSEFTINGEVLEGPAEENLTTYKITTDHEQIYINLT